MDTQGDKCLNYWRYIDKLGKYIPSKAEVHTAISTYGLPGRPISNLLEQYTISSGNVILPKLKCTPP
jgi:hypothetical protein